MHSQAHPADQETVAVTAQLLHALSQSQTLVDALHHYSAITVTDLRGHITYANALFLQASGYTLSELLGKSHQVLNSGIHPPTFWQDLWATISAGGTWRGVICNRAKDASTCWFDTQISPILDPTGKVEQYVSLRTDITALMLAKAAANEVAEVKRQFFANMSHELRTPMNAILGMLSLLDHTPLDPRQTEFRAKAEVAAHTLLGLINQLLDFSKIDASKIALDCQPFDLPQLLHKVAELAHAGFGSKPVQLQLDLDPALPRTLIGDAPRLQQVLHQLLGNAVKFTAQGQVTLQARLLAQTPSDATLRLAVSDSGIGIAMADQHRIFESFTQAQGASTREFGGTGLGLSIAQRLLALMGAELKLDSTPGEGSVFFFNLILPVAHRAMPAQPSPALASACVSRRAGPAEGQPQPQPQPQGRPLKGLRLLVVEDNAINQMVARELLGARGAKVEIADNGQLGVAAVAAAVPPFDAVLMDVQMPVMDGYAATRAIRADLGLATLPIIGLTANTQASDREACLAAGMNAHVGKPFNIAALVATLLQHLN